MFVGGGHHRGDGVMQREEAVQNFRVFGDMYDGKIIDGFAIGGLRERKQIIEERGRYG